MDKKRLKQIYKLFQESNPAFFQRDCKVQGITKEDLKEFFNNLEFEK